LEGGESFPLILFLGYFTAYPSLRANGLLNINFKTKRREVSRGRTCGMIWSLELLLRCHFVESKSREEIKGKRHEES
jgi:hypothetical protein